ncbi:hypothetical protein BJ508DRAFT_54892 [Ascobolus immersus RN42]|uniref:Uncharacterized protein n=1 Tax=Ascobolus immersus RN42 TaxID=1160509 RepID=A0A3N4HIC8_ASCIM|nr:hypothetical protein BJ508DRAFT_54892 [Ascobolus immersus RN42]
MTDKKHSRDSKESSGKRRGRKDKKGRSDSEGRSSRKREGKDRQLRQMEPRKEPSNTAENIFSYSPDPAQRLVYPATQGVQAAFNPNVPQYHWRDYSAAAGMSKSVGYEGLSEIGPGVNMETSLGRRNVAISPEPEFRPALALDTTQSRPVGSGLRIFTGGNQLHKTKEQISSSPVSPIAAVQVHELQREVRVLPPQLEFMGFRDNLAGHARDANTDDRKATVVYDAVSANEQVAQKRQAQVASRQEASGITDEREDYPSPDDDLKGDFDSRAYI